MVEMGNLKQKMLLYHCTFALLSQVLDDVERVLMNSLDSLEIKYNKVQ